MSTLVSRLEPCSHVITISLINICSKLFSYSSSHLQLKTCFEVDIWKFNAEIFYNMDHRRKVYFRQQQNPSFGCGSFPNQLSFGGKFENKLAARKNFLTICFSFQVKKIIAASFSFFASKELSELPKLQSWLNSKTSVSQITTRTQHQWQLILL